MENKTRILLAEDHGTVREGIKLLVNSQPDMTVIGEAENGEDAVGKVRELMPDLVVMDISMPKLNGLKATKRIRQTGSKVRILMLTRHMDHGYLQQLVKAGANGYVLKQSAPTELINAIRAVTDGKSFIDPSLMQRVMGMFAGRSENLRGENSNEITEREAEVLRLIAWGYSNKEIAGRLELSVKTVETHKTNTMRKLGMSSRIDIVRYALLQGWLQDN